MTIHFESRMLNRLTIIGKSKSRVRLLSNFAEIIQRQSIASICQKFCAFDFIRKSCQKTFEKIFTCWPKLAYFHCVRKQHADIIKNKPLQTEMNVNFGTVTQHDFRKNQLHENIYEQVQFLPENCSNCTHDLNLFARIRR